jgi:hypothetical protein
MAAALAPAMARAMTEDELLSFGRAGIEYAVIRPRNLDAVLDWLR